MIKGVWCGGRAGVPLWAMQAIASSFILLYEAYIAVEKWISGGQCSSQPLPVRRHDGCVVLPDTYLYRMVLGWWGCWVARWWFRCLR